MTGAAGVPSHPDTSDAALRRVTDTLAANAERYDRSAEFPWESIHAVHEAGLLTLGIGPAYGGRELSATEAARVLQALGRGDPSVALLTAMTVFQHVSQARLPRWPEALYRRAEVEAELREDAEGRRQLLLAVQALGRRVRVRRVRLVALIEDAQRLAPELAGDARCFSCHAD